MRKMAPTTMQPHRQIYNSVIQSYPDAAKFFLRFQNVNKFYKMQEEATTPLI